MSMDNFLYCSLPNNYEEWQLGKAMEDVDTEKEARHGVRATLLYYVISGVLFIAIAIGLAFVLKYFFFLFFFLNCWDF